MTGDYVPMGHVYRCYDRDGGLLYIGSAADMDTRKTFHESFSFFASLIADWQVSEPMPLAEARVTEKAAIALERPPLNQNHNPDYAGLSRAAKWARYREALLAVPQSLPADIYAQFVDAHMQERAYGTQARKEQRERNEAERAQRRAEHEARKAGAA